MQARTEDTLSENDYLSKRFILMLPVYQPYELTVLHTIVQSLRSRLEPDFSVSDRGTTSSPTGEPLGLVPCRYWEPTALLPTTARSEHQRNWSSSTMGALSMSPNSGTSLNRVLVRIGGPQCSHGEKRPASRCCAFLRAVLVAEAAPPCGWRVLFLVDSHPDERLPLGQWSLLSGDAQSPAGPLFVPQQ